MVIILSKLKLHLDVEKIELTWLTAKNELIFSLPFLNGVQSHYFQTYVLNPHERTRFISVFNEGVNHIQLTSVEDCDYVLLPFKWRTTALDPSDGRPSAEPYIKLAKDHGKKLLVLFEDDYDGPLNLSSDEGIVLRTSFYKSRRKSNEFALPVFRCDRFKNNYITNKSEKPTVGFCGFFNSEAHGIRKYALHCLEKDNRIDTNYIIRDYFWAQGVAKDVAVSDHYSNITDNMFTLCSRGAGNHSMRLYEVLSMGRIPIQVDTDCVYPFENVIDWNRHCVIVPEKDIHNISTYVIDFYNSKSDTELLKMQIRNRKLWEKYLSPLGFVKNVKEAFYDSSNK
tara:strand:+ start:8044 stop:9060 length:1017 start_codon:yes stop_codon:yes gene_type:complete